MNSINLVYFLAGQSYVQEIPNFSLLPQSHLIHSRLSLYFNYQSINIQKRSEFWRSIETPYFKDIKLFFLKSLPADSINQKTME